MSLTLEYINGHDIDHFVQAVSGRYSPYIASAPGMSAFQQGGREPGHEVGYCWRVYNTAFKEINYPVVFGSRQHVVARFSCKFDVLESSTFFRMESGSNNNALILKMVSGTGQLQVRRGGLGNNAQTGGLVVATTPEGLTAGQFMDVEVRVDCPTGRVRVWFNNTLQVDGVGLVTAAYVDRVTWRWERLGSAGLYWDHYAIASDSAETDERLGICRIASSLVTADYSTSPLWVPRFGVPHWRMVGDINSNFDANPADNYYLTSTGAGDDLFTHAGFTCAGLILGVGLNVARKRITGDPRIAGLILHPDGSGVEEIGPGVAFPGQEPYPTNWTYEQFILQLDPQADDDWNDATLNACAFGIRGDGNSRATMVYLEKLYDATGLPYACGDEGGSYII